MKQFEYRIKPRTPPKGRNAVNEQEDTLNEWGKEGWQVIAITPAHFYLIREKPPTGKNKHSSECAW